MSALRNNSLLVAALGVLLVISGCASVNFTASSNREGCGVVRKITTKPIKAVYVDLRRCVDPAPGAGRFSCELLRAAIIKGLELSQYTIVDRRKDADLHLRVSSRFFKKRVGSEDFFLSLYPTGSSMLGEAPLRYVDGLDIKAVYYTKRGHVVRVFRLYQEDIDSAANLINMDILKLQPRELTKSQ